MHPFSRIMEGALAHHQPPPASLDREDSNGSHFGIVCVCVCVCRVSMYVTVEPLLDTSLLFLRSQ